MGRLDRRASVEYDILGSKFDQSERPAGRGTPGGTAWEVAMRRSYLGGVHPASYKESTRRKPIVPLEEAPKQVVIPLTMCSGGGAVPVVRPGDPVTVGQVIAEPEGSGVYVHASVSGRVRAIEPRPHPWGGSWDAIVIDNDGKDTPCPDLPEPMDWSRMDRDEALDRICRAGITSMGAAPAPPTCACARRWAGWTP